MVFQMILILYNILLYRAVDAGMWWVFVDHRYIYMAASHMLTQVGACIP